MEQDNIQPNLPQDPSAQDAQTVGLKKAPEQNKEASWQKVDIVYNAAKKAFLEGASLPDVLDSFASTLLQIKESETQGLGGMGQGPQMDIPQPAPEDMPV